MSQNKNKLTEVDPIRSWLDVNQRMTNPGGPSSVQGSAGNVH